MVNLLIVQTTGDQELLWSFRNDEDWNVRRAVATRIEDQDRLWKMRKDKDYSVRRVVAELIENQDRLLKIRMSETARSIIRTIDDRLYKLACVAGEDTV